MRSRPLVRLTSALLALALLGAPAVLPQLALAATAQTTGGSGVTVQKTTVDGLGTPRNMTLSVDKTTNLVGRERVRVAWTGAQPTPYAAAPEQQREYPVVLMQCRGADTATTTIDRRACLMNASYRGNDGEAAYDAVRPAAGDPAGTDVPYATPDPAPTCKYTARDKTIQERTATALPYLGADGTVYRFCGDSVLNPGSSPADLTQGDAGLADQSYGGSTGPDGTGRYTFEVRTSEQHASLGCSASVPCSLVAVPVQQLPCVSGLELSALCQSGSLSANGKGENSFLQKSQWFQESNWRNRLSVPLGFLPTAAQCAQTDARPQLTVDGSELMATAMRRWVPAFCLDEASAFRLSYAPSGEGAARTGLGSGRFQAALTTRPVVSTTPPVVNAPVAVTGFAVSFVLESTVFGVKTTEVRELNLTPRLLAKLLTESYPSGSNYDTPDDPATPQNDPGRHPTIGSNPDRLDQDPEFLRVNPQYTATEGGKNALRYPTLISVDSDVTYELTRYIMADGAARAWLAGAPDEDGMIVNPAFTNIAWPSGQLELRDTTARNPNGLTNICAQAGQALLDITVNPRQSLRDAVLSVLDAKPTYQDHCELNNSSPNYGKLLPPQRQDEGSRAVFALSSVADAALYGLDTASLQVGVDPSGAPVFVKPTQDTMRTALGALEMDPASGTYRIDHSKLGATSYPGTMVVNAAIATSGKDATLAASYATLLEKVAGPFQTPGLAVGQLPTGYVPLPAELAAITRADAALVRAQQGSTVPASDTPPAEVPAALGQTDPAGPFVPGGGLAVPVAPGSSAPGPGGSAGDGTALPPQGQGQAAVGAPAAVGPAGAGPTAAAPDATVADATVPDASVPVVATTRAEQSAAGRWALPALLGIGLAVGLLGPLAFLVGQPGNPARRAGTWALGQVRGR